MPSASEYALSILNRTSLDIEDPLNGMPFTPPLNDPNDPGSGLLSSLANLPHEKRLPHVDAYFQETNEYYFERQPLLFYSVFQFYLLGRIHHPPETCPQDIMEEFKYWDIDPSPYLCPWCCVDSEDEDEYERNSESSTQNIDEFKNLKFGQFRRSVWRIIEEPATSSNVTLEREPHPILIQVEYVCIIWFSLEYFSKMLVTPNRWATFRQLLNIIDLLAILPFMIEMGLKIVGIDTEQLQDLKGAFLVIRILRVLRVIRVLKLGRYSSGLQMQLGMMAMVVMTGVIFFSTLVYFLEKDDPTSGFHSIPAACWWCIVTMTTVGYGDLTPVTVGK
uniref:Ion transport domain-containing protein n=1 Tax=Panagrolaimus sp. ES5 TaxID=591445 RepID=A0AC34GU10_9BILA